MTNTTSNFLMNKRSVLIIFGFIVSCNFSAEESDVRQQKVVFNDFHVSQIRGQILAAASETDTHKQYLKYTTGIEARSSANLIPSKFVFQDATESCVVASPNAMQSNGSGTLITDTRILTAHHVVYPQIDDVHRLTFESTSGYFKLASEIPNESFSEEVPFLSKRLFSLGLDSWAAVNPRAANNRSSLREDWRYSIDQEGKMQNIVNVNLTTNKGVGEDIAILKVRENDIRKRLTSDPSKDEFLISGPFDFSKPAVFFERLDAKQFREYKDTKCEADNTIPLYSYHSNIWPDETPEDSSRVSLVSNPGYRSAEASLLHCNPKWTSKKTCLEGGVVGYIDYQNCLKTTLDVRQGSSGGALSLHEFCRLNTCEGEGCPSGNIWYRPDERKRLVKGVLNGVTDNGSPLWLQDASTSTGSVLLTHDGMPVESGIDKLEIASLFTTVSNSVETNWLDRDIDYSSAKDPDNYKSHQPPNPLLEEKLKCAVHDVNASDPSKRENCLIYKSETKYPNNRPKPADTPDPPPIESNTPSNPENPASVFDNRAIDVDYTTQMMCQYRVPSNYEKHLRFDLGSDRLRIPHGTVIGFMGSPSTIKLNHSDQELTYISDFFAVCIPWSSASWFDNWNMAYVKGLIQDQSLEQATAYFPTYWMKLYEALRITYERRTEINAATYEVTRLRPPSMKTCPPNYHLQGISYHEGWKKDEDVPVILGIHTLHCTLMDSRKEAILASEEAGYGMQWSDLEKNLDVPLVKNLGNYTLSGDSFTMDNRIGDPTSQSTTENWVKVEQDTVRCDTVEVDGESYEATVTGFRATRRHDGTLRHLLLECGLSPGIIITPPPTP